MRFDAWTPRPGWERGPLKRIAQVSPGAMRPDGDNSGNIPLWGANGVIGGVGIGNLRTPAVVIGRVGTAGAVNVVAPPAWISDNALVATPIGDSDLRYLHYVLQVLELPGDAATTAQPLITQSQVREREIPIPPPDDQTRIADFLDTETARIDATIVKKRHMISLLAEHHRARRSTTILRGLDPVHGRNDCDLPCPWRVVALGVLVGLHRGFDLPREEREPGSVPVVSSGGISGRHSTAMCTGPGVVTGRYGTIGEVFFVEEPYWPLNTTLFVSDFRGNHPRWVYHMLSALPLEYDAAKSAVTGINRNVIGGLRVPYVPVIEQRSIARTLDRASEQKDTVCRSLARQIELLKEHRQALVAAAVTGAVDIPGRAA